MASSDIPGSIRIGSGDNGSVSLAESICKIEIGQSRLEQRLQVFFQSLEQRLDKKLEPAILSMESNLNRIGQRIDNFDSGINQRFPRIDADHFSPTAAGPLGAEAEPKRVSFKEEVDAEGVSIDKMIDTEGLPIHGAPSGPRWKEVDNLNVGLEKDTSRSSTNSIYFSRCQHGDSPSHGELSPISQTGEQSPRSKSEEQPSQSGENSKRSTDINSKQDTATSSAIETLRHVANFDGASSSSLDMAHEMSVIGRELERLQQEGMKVAFDQSQKRARNYMAVKGWLVEEQSVVNDLTLVQKIDSWMKAGNFDLIVGTMIMLNVGLMIARMELHGRELIQKVDLNKADAFSAVDLEELTVHGHIFFKVADMFFNLFFLGELMMRILVEQCQLCCHPWRLFDAALVVLSFIEVLLENMPFKPILLRLLRLLRLARMLRVIRAIQTFRMLRILARTIIGSVQGLAWSIVLLGITMVMGAIVLGQTTRGYLEDADTEDAVRRFVLRYFGTFGRCCFTIFQWTLGGVCPPPTRQLIEEVSPLFSIFVICYTMTVSFALVRVIGAIFIRETLASAQKDAELVIEEMLKNKNHYVEQVRNIFKEFDTNGDGLLDQEEFKRALSDDRLGAWLMSLDINVQETTGLFALMDNGTGKLSCDELIAGAVRLRGDAKTLDIVSMMYETKKVIEQITRLQEQVQLCLVSNHRNSVALNSLRKQVPMIAHMLSNGKHEVRGFTRTSI